MAGQVFVDAKAITVWLSGEGPQLAGETPPADPSTAAAQRSSSSSTDTQSGGQGTDKFPGAAPGPTLPARHAEPAKPPRDTSPQALATLQSALKPVLDAMVKELDAQAHFVAYASPGFIGFRNGVYLELSINTNLAEPQTASRYRLAALAFDNHVAHLIRPVLGYLKDDSQFDGVGIS